MIPNNELCIPSDVKTLESDELNLLANNIRHFLINQIAQTGGHIGANLGTIELTIALHAEFTSPIDSMLFDTGHIGYTHKLLTGRKDLFPSLNSYGGMNRFLTPKESEHDIIEASHAGTAISVGLGIALSNKLLKKNNHTIAVVGDSAFAEGSSLEALNHAIVEDTNLIIILNDNGYAISPGFGGLHQVFNSSNDKALTFFESLGLDYIGPVDGHNISEIRNALSNAKQKKKLPIVHLKTIKGFGWKPADSHPFRMHYSFPFDAITGQSKATTPADVSYADIAGDEVLSLMENNEKIIAITPSTIYATGFANIFQKYPQRAFDPGMEEQHALSMTVGFALQGFLPIIAFQSTFLQRAFDQLLHDVCFTNKPTIILSTRSGFSGYDNPTHHGIYDISYLQPFPNLSIYYPKDGLELREMIRFIGNNCNGPTMIMMPYGPAENYDNANKVSLNHSVLMPEKVLHGKDTVLISVGNKFMEAKTAALELGAGLINIRCLSPLNSEAILDMISSYENIITIEEAAMAGGFGSSILALISDNKLNKNVLRLGLPNIFVEPGSNEELCKIYGLDSDGIVNSIKSFLEK